MVDREGEGEKVAEDGEKVGEEGEHGCERGEAVENLQVSGL